MSSSPPYRTRPELIDTMPPGIPYIVGNEAAERFSFYGMKAILLIYMTQYLGPENFGEAEARSAVHLFNASAYFFPILGALLADVLWGKYRTILTLSLVYCLGHVVLSLSDVLGHLGPQLHEYLGSWAGWFSSRRVGLALGLGLIAVGAGGIKPCVSAHVGDQFSVRNQHLLPRVFSWFYFSINLGATTSMLLTPVLLRHAGPEVAFGVPAVLMFVATWVFWLGRHKFVHIPPGGRAFLREAFSAEGRGALLRLVPVYLLVAMFWAVFDQTGSAWIQQALAMDRRWLGWEWYSDQIQAVNAVLVLTFIPLFAYVIYPAVGRVVRVTPLRKMAAGMFVAAAACAIPWWIATQIQGGSVVTQSDELHPQFWSARSVLDGQKHGAGWVAQVDQQRQAQLTLRLRQRQSWTVDRVVLHGLLGVEIPLENEAGNFRLGREHLPEAVQIEAAPAPAGPWRQVEQKTLTWSPAGEATVRFEPVETEYLRLRFTAPRGVPVVALAEVEVLAASGISPPQDEFARQVWPNVAAVGHRPSIGWQLLAYVVITAAEILVSITCLEYSYTQAPRKMKSLVMGVFLLSVTLGNLFTSAVNRWIQLPDGRLLLEGPDYFAFFAAAMLAAAVLFVPLACFLPEKTYIQE